MRRRTHLVTGGVIFIAYCWLLLLLLEIPGRILLAGLFLALLGSVAPDVLEPARHGNHRGIAHSRGARRASAGAFVLTAVLGAFQPLVPALSLSFLFSGFLLGYFLHLLADGLTPAGLPG
jgi:membrane-bound metal-dependent hydrolase YbcI (DUF457 family)